MTQEEFDSLVQRVTNALQGSSNMATDLRVVKSPIGVNLLPGILSGELVTLEAASLMGTDGKTPLFEVGAISSGLEADASITLSGTDPSGNPIYKIGLVLPKGDSGKNPILEFEGISTGEPDTDATASFKENGTTEDGQPKYKLSLTIPRGSKGDKGNDGKTPVMEAGSVSKGLEPSVSIIPNGDDPLGNPKYKIDLVLPQGDAGKNPVLEFSEIVTGAAGSEASAVFTPVGQTPEGNPKYSLKLTIPRGDTGLPGTGSGNVSVNGSDLIRGKQYLFVPSSDGSTEGSFVEYIPFNDAELREEIGRNLQLAKTYTNEQIAGIVQFDIKVVLVLPDTGVKGTIYLVPKTGSGNDVHNEYIWNETSGKFELIGSTSVDLSDYYTKNEANERYVLKETNKRLITKEEGEKLSGIEEGANKFEYPIDPEVGKVLTWGESGAIWSDISDGVDLLILGSFRTVGSTSTDEQKTRVLNGHTFNEILDAVLTNKPIYTMFNPASSPMGFSVVKAAMARVDGTNTYIYMTTEYYNGFATPSDYCLEKRLLMIFDNTTGVLTGMSALGKLLSGYDSLTFSDIPFNGGSVFGFISNSDGTWTPRLTFPHGLPNEGDETSVIMVNSYIKMAWSKFTLGSNAPTGTRLLMINDFVNIENGEAVEINIKYINKVFSVRVSEPFKYN